MNLSNSSGTSSLSDMLAVARYIDISVLELEQVLTSIDGLMPTEDNQPQAEKVLGEVVQAVKELEEHSHELKISLEKQLAASQKELEEATTKNNAIEQGIAEIESTLKQYGYDNSSLPNLSPEIITIDDGDNDNVTDDESFNIEEGTMNSPTEKIYQLSESMASVEITPLVLSSKSSHSSHQVFSPNVEVPSSQKVIRVPASFTPGRHPYLNGSSPVLKSSEKQDVKPPVLVRPQRPILSRTTYELLGEQPPPEFFIENKCH